MPCSGSRNRDEGPPAPRHLASLPGCRGRAQKDFHKRPTCGEGRSSSAYRKLGARLLPAIEQREASLDLLHQPGLSSQQARTVMMEWNPSFMSEVRGGAMLCHPNRVGLHWCCTASANSSQQAWGPTGPFPSGPRVCSKRIEVLRLLPGQTHYP